MAESGFEPRSTCPAHFPSLLEGHDVAFVQPREEPPAWPLAVPGAGSASVGRCAYPGLFSSLTESSLQAVSLVW